MRTPLRNTAAAAVLALLLTGVSACNDDSSGDAADKPAESSSTTSSDAGSEATASSSAPDEASSAPAGKSVTRDEVAAIVRNGMGAVTTARIRMTSEVSLKGQQASLDANGYIRMKPFAESLTFDLSGTRMEVRVVDDVFYMKGPMLGTGDKWMRIPTSQLDALGMGGVGDALSDPAAMAEKSSRYVTSATYLGEEDVAGAPARHYTMTLDVDGLLKQLNVPPAMGDLPKSATQDLWVDAKGRIVKMTQDMLPLQTTTMTMSDFGTKVDVTAPPASQVTDMPGRMAG